MKRVGLTEAQRRLKRNGTGSSEIATVAGIGWGSILEVWANKVHGLDKEPTLAMELGALVEAGIADRYSLKTGKQISRSGTLVCEGKPNILATPDRWVHHRKPAKRPRWAVDWDSVERILEAKHASMRARSMLDEDGRPLWGAPGTDEVPQEYLAQSTWLMRATGAKADAPRVRLVDVAALFDKDAYEIYTVPYDAELAAGLEEINDRFWTDFVLPRREPPPDTAARFREMLARLHPAPGAGAAYLQAPPELAAAAMVLRELKHAAKWVGDRIELIEAAIAQHIGDAAGMVGTFGTITWKLEAGRPAYKAVAEGLREELRKHVGDAAAARYAELLAAHTKPQRVLRKSWSKMLDELAEGAPPPPPSPLERRLEAGPFAAEPADDDLPVLVNAKSERN